MRIKKFRGGDGFAWTLGNCFQDSANYLMRRRPDAALCHGIVTGDGGLVEGLEYVHAWLEYRHGRRRVCLSLGDEYPRKWYYLRGKARSIVRYTLVQACRMMSETGRFGPWAPELLRCQQAAHAAVARLNHEGRSSVGVVEQINCDRPLR
jgi:hypothetical protein